MHLKIQGKMKHVLRGMSFPELLMCSIHAESTCLLLGHQVRILTYLYKKLEALERLYRSTGLIFLQWQKKFLTIIIQSLHFSSLKKKGMEKTCEKRRKKW